jgi:plasmid stabilization system protein ParE
MVSRKRRIRWSRLADRDLDRDHAALREREPSAARRFAAEILRTVDQLGLHPEMGPVARDIPPVGRYRHFPVGRHRIIYRIDDGEVCILRIWDTRRDPEELIPEEK